MRHYILGVCALVCSLFIVGAVHAGGGGVDSPVPIDDSIPNIVGVAVGIAPDYQGSNDYKPVAAPYFRFSFDG
jgi:outer membrane scaffolding protein for murein synthesis (MipA/OmpV family)